MKTASVSLKGTAGFLSEAVKFKNVRNILSAHKVLFMLVFAAVFMCSGLFAAETGTGEDFGVASAMQTVIDFLTNKWVIGIFFVAFCVECILLMTAGRADGQAWKKFVPILAGTILFLAGPSITKKFMKVDTLNENAKSLLE